MTKKAETKLKYLGFFSEEYAERCAAYKVFKIGQFYGRYLWLHGRTFLDQFKKRRFIKRTKQLGFDERELKKNIQIVETSPINSSDSVGMTLARSTFDNHYSIRREKSSDIIVAAVDGIVYKWRRKP